MNEKKLASEGALFTLSSSRKSEQEPTSQRSTECHSSYHGGCAGSLSSVI